MNLKRLTNTFFILILAFVLLSCGNEDNIGPDGRTEIETRALELINSHRSRLNLPPLEHHPAIFEEAKRHSVEMASRLVPFGHEGFNDRVNRIRSFFSLSNAGENVAFNGSNTPAITAVDQWLASNVHLENIENPVYNFCGLAAARDNNGTYYFTHIFVEVQ